MTGSRDHGADDARSPSADAPVLHGHRHEVGHAHGARGCDHDHAHGLAGDFAGEALISARGLSVRRGGRLILDHVDLDIAPREIVTLIGPNGSGKTTLVKTLLGLLPADSGEVRRATGLSIGYVPQRFEPDPALPMTAERFLRLGNAASAAEVAAVLAESGAAAVARRQLSALSGGELQRVLLARALLGAPKLLVLDEPAQGVDYLGEAELYTMIEALRDARGLGILFVSHDLHVVMAQSDRVICLNHHVCCSGVPETVANHPEYVRLFGAEMARALGVYHHHHDHRHDLAGRPASAEGRSRA